MAFVVIDIPQALDVLESDDGATMARAGLDFEFVPIPLGTPDVTKQMQQVKDRGAGVVHILGNDAFCIDAIKDLLAARYDGAISGVSYCFTDATRAALRDDLEGINVLAPLANGATDDPTYQLYLAGMEKYGAAVDDIDGSYALSGYAVVATLATALETLDGDVTREAVAETVRSMPESELPAGGGQRFRCGGSAMPGQPGICTNQWLRGELDATGNSTHYTVEDSTNILG